MPRHRHSKRRSHRRSKVMGGDGGASQHAINTYGGIGAQHASTGNLIAVNQGTVATPAVVTGGGELQPAVYGGADINKNGGGIITDIAVPAALILTRNVISKRRLPGLPRLSMGRRSRRNRRRSSRRRR